MDFQVDFGSVSDGCSSQNRKNGLKMRMQNSCRILKAKKERGEVRLQGPRRKTRRQYSRADTGRDGPEMRSERLSARKGPGALFTLRAPRRGHLVARTLECRRLGQRIHPTALRTVSVPRKGTEYYDKAKEYEQKLKSGAIPDRTPWNEMEWN